MLKKNNVGIGSKKMIKWQWLCQVELAINLMTICKMYAHLGIVKTRANFSFNFIMEILIAQNACFFYINDFPHFLMLLCKEIIYFEFKRE